MISISPKLSTREEAVLSYLCGLSPVGEEIFVHGRQATYDLGDIGTCSDNMLKRHMERLKRLGAVKAVGLCRYVVFKRPEEFGVRIPQHLSDRNDDAWRTFG